MFLDDISKNAQRSSFKNLFKFFAKKLAAIQLLDVSGNLALIQLALKTLLAVPNAPSTSYLEADDFSLASKIFGSVSFGGRPSGEQKQSM